MIQYDEDLIFRALGDATRRAMLERLDAGPLAVTALAEPFSVTLTAITQHVRTLERAGLIRSEKTGRERICSVDRDGLARAEKWIATRRWMWERRLDRLGVHLEERTPDPKDAHR